jgi:hypothetical protein
MLNFWRSGVFFTIFITEFHLMNFLKHLSVIVFAVFLFTACEKSTVTPRHKCGGEAQTQPSNTPSDQPQNSGRSSVVADPMNDGSSSASINGTGGETDSDGSEISGSGDDDRDGGEKRKKR